MRLFRIILLMLLSAPMILKGQERSDSIVEISGVEVRALRSRMAGGAGMHESAIDSVLFSAKVNFSLSDLLSENTAVFVKSHGRGALATASFRGMAPSHTRLSWNGIRINSPMAGMVDFSLIPAYIIDDISLKHGAASITDGSGGLGGSIIIGNRADWDEGFKLSFIQGAGSYGTYDSYLQAGTRIGAFQVRSRLYHKQSANDFSFINRGIGVLEDGRIVHPAERNDQADFTHYGFLQEIYLQPARRHAVSVKWWSQWADRNIPQAISYEGPGHASLNRQADIDHRMSADWNLYTERGRFTWRSGYSRKHLDYSLRHRIGESEFVPAIYSVSTQSSLFNHAGWSLEMNDRLSIQTVMDLDLHRVDSHDSVLNLGYSRKRHELSLMVSGQYALLKRLRMNLIIRQDMINGRLAPLVPFAGVDLDIVKESVLVFKAYVNRNYRHPTMNDLYWQPGGNPGLLPEEGFSMETGFHYAGQLRQTNIEAGLTAYRTDMDNWIIWIPSFKGYWEPQNISRVLSYGIDASVRLQSTIGKVGIKIVSTYAYTRSINYGDPLIWGDASYGKQLVYIPVHSGNVFTQLSYRGFHLGWQHHSYGERFTTTSNNVSRRDWLYPYYMNDLIIGKKYRTGKLQLTGELKVYNLFDETYHSVLYRPMPGRHFMLMLRLDLHSGQRAG